MFAIAAVAVCAVAVIGGAAYIVGQALRRVSTAGPILAALVPGWA